MFDDILKAVGVNDLAKISEPVVQVVGTKTICVLNMLGVVLLSSDEILLRATKNYNIRICGQNLVCKMMNKNETIVSGRISNISWECVIS